MKKFKHFLLENETRQEMQDEYFDILDKHQHPETGHFNGGAENLTRLGNLYNSSIDAPGGHVSDHLYMAIDSPHNKPEDFFGLNGTALNVAMTSPSMPIEHGEHLLNLMRVGHSVFNHPTSVFAVDSAGQFTSPEIHFLHNPNHTAESFSKHLNYLLGKANEPFVTKGIIRGSEQTSLSNSSIPMKSRADYRLIKTFLGNNPQENKIQYREPGYENHDRLNAVRDRLLDVYDKRENLSDKRPIRWKPLQISHKQMKQIFANAGKQTSSDFQAPYDEEMMRDLYDFGE